MVGLPVDDAEELEQLGLGRRRRGAEHGRGRALNRGEWRAELVAHHSEELRPLPLQLLERPKILHGDDDRYEFPLLRMDRRDVDERPDAPTVGHRQLDLLGAHRRGVLELSGQGKLLERDLRPVGVPPRHHLEELLGRVARSPNLLDDALGLAVERHRAACSGVEDDDPDR